MAGERRTPRGAAKEEGPKKESAIKDTGQKRIRFTQLEKFLADEFGINQKNFSEKIIPALQARADSAPGNRDKLIPQSGWACEILSGTDAVISVRSNGALTAYRITKSNARQIDWTLVPASVDRKKITPAELTQYMVEKPSISIAPVTLDTVSDSNRTSRRAHGTINGTDESLLHNRNEDD